MAWITVGYKTREIASFVPVKQPMTSFARNIYLERDISNNFLLFLPFSPLFLFFIYIIFPRNIEFRSGLLSVILRALNVGAVAENQSIV